MTTKSSFHRSPGIALHVLFHDLPVMLSTGSSHHLSWGSKEQPVEMQSSRRAKRRKVSILSRPGQWNIVSTLLVLVLIQCVLGSYNPTSAAVSDDATEEHPAEERNNNYRDKWSSAATEDEKRVQVREFAKRSAGNPDSSSSVIDEDVVVGQDKDHRASDNNNPRKVPRITRWRLEGLIRNMTDGK